VLSELRARDTRDRGREHSPLEAAPDAVVIDTSDLDAGEVVERIVALVRAADSARGR
jgi:cytidylate kinase